MMSGITVKSLVKSLYVAAFAMPVLLTACGGTIQPGPMPTGYKYHNTTYKAPAGAEPAFWERDRKADTEELTPDDGRRASAGDGGAIESQMMGLSPDAVAWLPASRDLIGKIKNRLGFPMEPTFFEGLNGAVPGFESALKAATSEYQWPHAATKGSGPFHLAYSATPADPATPDRMMLTVRLTVSKQNLVIEESGVYSISAGNAAAEAPVSGAASNDPVAMTPNP